MNTSHSPFKVFCVSVVLAMVLLYLSSKHSPKHINWEMSQYCYSNGGDNMAFVFAIDIILIC